MASHNFISCISSYTGELKNSATCTDHIFDKNIILECIDSMILKSNIADHYLTIINIDPKKSNENKTYYNINYEKRYKQIHFLHLNSLLKLEDWSNLAHIKDINILAKTFNNKINFNINLSIIEKIVYVNSNKNKRNLKNG